MDSSTSTARWSLVIHRVGGTSAKVCVGTLFPDLKKPKRARVRLFEEDGEKDRELKSRTIQEKDWRCPFRKMRQRFFSVAEFNHFEKIWIRRFPHEFI